MAAAVLSFSDESRKVAGVYFGQCPPSMGKRGGQKEKETESLGKIKFAWRAGQRFSSLNAGAAYVTLGRVP